MTASSLTAEIDSGLGTTTKQECESSPWVACCQWSDTLICIGIRSEMLK